MRKWLVCIDTYRLTNFISLDKNGVGCIDLSLTKRGYVDTYYVDKKESRTFHSRRNIETNELMSGFEIHNILKGKND